MKSKQLLPWQQSYGKRMNATFHLNADELGLPLLEKIRTMFAHQTIRLSVALEEAEASPRTVRLTELESVLDTSPYMSRDETEQFAHDIRESRRQANLQSLRDPWDM